MNTKGKAKESQRGTKKKTKGNANGKIEDTYENRRKAKENKRKRNRQPRKNQGKPQENTMATKVKTNENPESLEHQRNPLKLKP